MARRLKTIVTALFTVFWGKLCGQKAGAIVKAWVQNTVNYSVLEEVVWQQGLKHCFSIRRKLCSVLEQVVWSEGLNNCYSKTQCFWGKQCGQKDGAIVEAWVENTVIYSVLEKVVWQEGFYNCYNIIRKHCNLQCFGASSVSRRMEPLWKHG